MNAIRLPLSVHWFLLIDRADYAVRWAPLEIPLQKLCNSDHEKQIQLSCWHFSNNGTHNCIGEATFTVNQLIKNNIRTLDIINVNKKKLRSKRNINSGTVRILHSQVETTFSLLDFVRGGCVIRLAFAVDLTLSNGDPSLIDSLHSTSEGKNEYIQVIEGLGAVMTQYDPGSRIPMCGFGAKVSNTSQPYCFPLGGSEDKAEANGIERRVAYRLPNVVVGRTQCSYIWKKFRTLN